MKKLLSSFSAITLLTSLSFNAVACNIGEQSTHKYLSSLEDFDWSNGSTGYDLELKI
ncbi:hypothetical protein SCLARK_00383 [Spiroplasma clarkii]|uniref:lipoprotein n=1 Tax=Spiroplasma clarkii TaxID=2139 RepID=UPI000B57758E|nr:lipoprotein [Spiroplasma clarkii]ARU91118.1 hypothetical protein SCLARK_00383 [Spiroplasma clarkii]